MLFFAICLTASGALHPKVAPVFAKELVASSDAIVLVAPGAGPLTVHVDKVIYTDSPLADKVLTLQPTPAPSPNTEGQYNFIGVKEPTILFLSRPKPGLDQWRLVSYYHAWIPMANNRVTYSNYSKFDLGTAKFIVTRRLGNDLLFSEYFKPHNNRFATLQELTQELGRLVKAVHAKNGARLESVAIGNVSYEDE